MSETFRDFMSSGLASVAGSMSLSARVGAAALAVGLSFSLPTPASAGPDARKAETAATDAVKRVPLRDLDDDLGTAQEVIRFYGNVGHRHGLDPVSFALSALVDHEVSGLDADKVVLPVSTGKGGSAPKLGSHDLQRWVGLVLRHGVEAGAGDAVAAYNAALKLEDGMRRRPVTTKVLKHIAMMRDDHSVDAEILAREAVRVKGILASSGIDASDPKTLYLASSFGPDKARAFLAASATTPTRPAHEVLGVRPEALKEVWKAGKSPTVAQFGATLTGLVDLLKESVEKEVEMTVAGSFPKMG